MIPESRVTTYPEPCRANHESRDMHLVERNNQFAVYDDVLPSSEFKAVVEYLQLENYQWVHAAGWQKVWRLSDGFPLQGPMALSHATGQDAPVYPTQTKIDAVISTMLEVSKDLTDLVGALGQDWKALTARPYLYPQGAGLSWHGDGASYTGAYVFYAHPVWNIQWGGELLIATGQPYRVTHRLSDPSSGAGHVIRSLATVQSFDNSFYNEKIFEKGVGYYVLPKPNRLAILKGACMHTVKRVDPAAGNHTRLSVAGFFLSATAPPES